MSVALKKDFEPVVVIVPSSGPMVLPKEIAVELGFGPTGQTREAEAVLDENGDAVLTTESHAYPEYSYVS